MVVYCNNILQYTTILLKSSITLNNHANLEPKKLLSYLTSFEQNLTRKENTEWGHPIKLSQLRNKQI